MNAIISLTSKRQATFPKQVLDFLGISSGDKLLIKVCNDQVTLKPITSTLNDLQGILSKTAIGKKMTLEQVVEKAKKNEALRLLKQGK